MMKNDICESIEKDEFFRQFLTEQKSSESLNSSVAYTVQISKLTEGLELISSELHSQVREQHGALLSQASHARKLENAIDVVYEQVHAIQKSGDRIKNQIIIPYSILKSQIEVLERLQEASHILRQTGRFLHLYRKLQSTKDLIEQASIIHDLEPFVISGELENIDFIKDEIAFTLSTKQKLISLATIDLNNGLKNNKEAKIENGIQILAKLHKLSSSIDDWLKTFIEDIKLALKEIFAGTDVSTQKTSNSANKVGSRGPGKLPTLTTSQNFRQKLWQSIEWLFNEEIYSFCEQAILLQKCVEKIDLSNTDWNFKNSIQLTFWHELEILLESSFRDCPPHVGQCLQQSLPKLLAATKSLEKKLNGNLKFAGTTFKSLEGGYLEKCGLTFKQTLPSADYPTQDSVDNLVRAGSIELSAALVDEHLCLLVAGVFSAVNSDFWNKIEAYIKLGAESQQVLDVPNASQIQNTTLANTIFYHSNSVKRMIGNLGTNFSAKAYDKIFGDLKTGEILILTILQQLIESMKATLSIIMLSMHREPGLNSAMITTNTPSLFMKEFQEVLQRSWTSHIALFNDVSLVEQCGKELAKDCIELFIQNIAILRPISNAGRNRIKSDCLYLESALQLICSDLSVLGKQYRMLRAVSSIIVLMPEKIIESYELDGTIPPYIILMLLFSFAGSDFLSPHTAAGWSNEKLLQWLDGHSSERERLEIISGALQKYRLTVRQKNIAQYDPVYPLISSYLEKVLAYYSM